MNRDMYLLHRLITLPISGNEDRRLEDWPMRDEHRRRVGRDRFCGFRAWENRKDKFITPCSRLSGGGQLFDRITRCRLAVEAFRQSPATPGECANSWTEGMGWQRGGSVAWQLFDRDGDPLGEGRGNAEGVPVWSSVAGGWRLPTAGSPYCTAANRRPINLTVSWTLEMRPRSQRHCRHVSGSS